MSGNTVGVGGNKLADRDMTAFEVCYPSSERPALYSNGQAAGEIRQILRTELS